MALQLIAMNGLWDRPDSRWMALAMSSFPVPLSPLIKTELSLRAILVTVSKTVDMDRLRPTISGNACCQFSVTRDTGTSQKSCDEGSGATGSSVRLSEWLMLSQVSVRVIQWRPTTK